MIFGIPIIITANDIVEFSIDYTNCKIKSDGTCTVQLKVNETIPGPVYFYYEINNFYMNHRDFVKSRSFSQLRGEENVNSSNNSICEGAIYMSEMFDNNTARYKTYTGKPLKGSDFANPCGLIAKSYFNDTEFKIINSKGEEQVIDEKNIANEYDVKYMFKRNEKSEDLQWIDVENRM